MNNNDVLLILDDDFEEIEAIGTFAILKRSNINIDIFTLSHSEIHGRYGLNINYPVFSDKVDLSKYDMLFIAGGPEYKALEASSTFKNVIKYFNDNHKFIAAICAGPTLLGHLGILENKNYTCFKSMNEDFKGNYKYEYVVKDQNIITGISAAGTIDFAFKIVEALKGKEFSKKIQDSIYYDAKKMDN